MRRDRRPLVGASWFALTWNFAVVFGGAAFLWACYDLVQVRWDSVAPTVWQPLALVLVAVIVSELRPLVWAGLSSEDDAGVSLSSALVLAGLFVWGPAVGLVLQAVATLTGELVKRKASWRVAFNVGQYELCLLSAAVVAGIGSPVGMTSLNHPLTADQITAAAVLWMLPAWLAYHFANLALVAGVREAGVTFRESFFDDFWYYTVSTLSVLVLSAVIAALAADNSWPLILFLGIPAFAVYRASTLSWRLHELAHRDQLTGLPNRRALEGALIKAVDTADATGTGVALLLLDLNEFKEVNDTLGHPAGDQLLQIVSDRAKRVLRPGDVLVRLGGDEFAVVMADVSTTADAAEVAQRLRAVIAEPARVGNIVLSVGASVGVATYPGDAKDQRTLLQRADVAMYQAKEHRSGVEIYQPDRDPNSADKLSIRLAFREALTSGELKLHFQPQIDLRTGDVVGVEGLLRWTHEGRAVPPAEFIAIASRSELSNRLTDYVLTRALEEARSLWDRGIRMPVSMNVSMNELTARYPRGKDLVGRVLAGLGDVELPPWALRLEISGDRVLGDESRAMATLKSLAENGILAALDDFGTGAASLAMLRRLPLAELKIDRSLISRVIGDPREQIVIRSIIEIAHGMELRVVAEGVENEGTAEVLRGLGCDAAQGFHFAPVLSAADLDDWLAARAPQPLPDNVRPLRAVGEGAD